MRQRKVVLLLAPDDDECSRWRLLLYVRGYRTLSAIDASGARAHLAAAGDQVRVIVAAFAFHELAASLGGPNLPVVLFGVPVGYSQGAKPLLVERLVHAEQGAQVALLGYLAILAARKRGPRSGDFEGGARRQKAGTS